jgi:hypothetical protein
MPYLPSSIEKSSPYPIHCYFFWWWIFVGAFAEGGRNCWLSSGGLLGRRRRVRGEGGGRVRWRLWGWSLLFVVRNWGYGKVTVCNERVWIERWSYIRGKSWQPRLSWVRPSMIINSYESLLRSNDILSFEWNRLMPFPTPELLTMCREDITWFRLPCPGAYAPEVAQQPLVCPLFSSFHLIQSYFGSKIGGCARPDWFFHRLVRNDFWESDQELTPGEEYLIKPW